MPTLPQLMSLAVAAVLLTACNGRTAVTPAGSNAATQPGAQNSTDASGNTLPDFAFTPVRGGAFSISLPGHGTQGYSWHVVTGFDASVVTALNPNEGRLGAAPTGGMLGPSASEIFDFKAGNAGTTRLIFSLYRNGEDPTRGTEQRAFTVTVQ
ncbi:MAG: Chagasin family peptidase inhibitor [Cyanobacteria bacterium RYN_339]|nr:Chagasin family peptidase inhibitor [Cyanobacteria bacterium RYN_339]